MAWVPGSRSKFGNWTSVPSLYSWNIAECDVKPQSTNQQLQNFKHVSFLLHGCCGNGKVGPVNKVNHTSWVTVVTPTDRPKSVPNRCVIELFWGVVCVLILPFDISVGVRAFVIGLSQISPFLSWIIRTTTLINNSYWNVCSAYSP